MMTPVLLLLGVLIATAIISHLIGKFIDKYVSNGNSNENPKLKMNRRFWIIMLTAVLALVGLLIFYSRQVKDQNDLRKTVQTTLENTINVLETTQQSLDVYLYFSNIECKDVKLVNLMDRNNRGVHTFEKDVFPEFYFHVANKYFLVGEYERAEEYYLKSLEQFENLRDDQLIFFHRTNYTPERLKQIEDILIAADLNMNDDMETKAINDPKFYKYYIYTNLYINSLSLYPKDFDRQKEYKDKAIEFHGIHLKGSPEHKLGL